MKLVFCLVAGFALSLSTLTLREMSKELRNAQKKSTPFHMTSKEGLENSLKFENP